MESSDDDDFNDDDDDDDPMPLKIRIFVLTPSLKPQTRAAQNGLCLVTKTLRSLDQNQGSTCGPI